MKPGRILFSLLILLGLLVNPVVPVAHAQSAAITFHYYGGANMTIPEDTEGTIVIEGYMLTAENGYGAIMLQNLCTGEDCTSQDIYYKISLAITWTNGWGEGHPEWITAPFPHYHLGGMNLPPIDTGICGGPTGASGSCAFDIEGTIPAEEISTDPDVAHETFMISYPAYYGGMDIALDYVLTFSTSPILNTQAPCSGQYNIGAALGAVTLPANYSTGINMLTSLGSASPVIGDYYVIEVSGAWRDNHAGPDLRTVEMEAFSSNPTWYPLEANPSVECTDVDTYYLQMTASPSVMFYRVHDMDGNFATNDGSLTLTFYAVAARTRYPSGCELQYETGSFIEQKAVNAEWSNGWPLQRPFYLPWNPNAVGGEGGSSAKRYYMLETLGGPAYLGTGGLTYDADLGARTSENDITPDLWYEIEAAPFVDCVISTDMIGHVKVYFALDEKTSPTEFIKYYYAFRVRDTGSYGDNSGTLSYQLYQATFLQTTAPGEELTAEGCDQFSHETPAQGTFTIQGNSAAGTLVTGLTAGGIFALEVAGGPWKDNGASKYDLEISDDNGNTWTDLQDYTNLLCAFSADEGDHVMIYLYGASGKIWKARANDTDGIFANNSLSITLNVYAGATLIDEFVTCGDDYSLTSSKKGSEENIVPGNSAAGTSVDLIAGNIYAIEITDASKWYEAGAGAGSYKVDISDDSGATWKHLESYSTLCAEQIGDGDRYKIFFTATTNQIQLRVRDGDDNFLSNTGWVVFDLSSAVNTANPPVPGPGTTKKPPPEWVVACNETYSRPDSFITWYPLGTILSVAISVPIPRVGEWIDYLRSAIAFYFAWCPQHTEALQSIGQVYMDREPMASIDAMMNFVKSIQTILQGYQTTGGEEASAPSQEPALFSDTGNIGSAEGGDKKAPSAPMPWDIFMIGNVDPTTSVWYGGKLDMAASLGSTNTSAMDSYRTMCSGKFYPLFGIGASPFCNLMAVMRWSSIMTWILLGLDFFILVYFVLAYIPRYLRRFWNLLTGNKQAVGKVINSL